MLNLPSWVVFGNGNRIEYVYDARGTKLRTVHHINGTTRTTDYCGNAIYEDGELKMLLNEAGYYSFQDNKYHFYLKDHQGNVRVVADEDGNVEETNDYYPFGGLMSNSSTSVQPYKYNGKELDRQGGLDWYDYGARHYDPVLGRFMTVDPMAEKYYGWSPYAYCLGNPVRFIDPTGKAAQIPPFLFSANNPILPIGGRITMLGTADKVARVLPKEEHHIIPRSLKGNEIVRAAREGEFKLEGKENKISIDKFSKEMGQGQHGKHPNYTEQIKQKLNQYKDVDLSPKQATEAVRTIMEQAKEIIKGNPNIKINDLKIEQQITPMDNTKLPKIEPFVKLEYKDPNII